MTRRVWFAVLLAIAVRSGAAQSARPLATPYVPTLDASYRDLDALADAGFVRTMIGAERPYSRRLFARFMIEAKAAIAAAPSTPLRFTEALARLEREFAAEARALCADGVAACGMLPRGATVRSVGTDLTWSDSPSRAIMSSYDTSGKNLIDADLNPLLQRNQGRVLADGVTLGLEGHVDYTWHPRFVAQLRPRVWGSAARGADPSADITALDAYVRMVAGAVALDVGRTQGAIGFGEDGGLARSHNPRGFDGARLSFDRPVRFPWIFRRLGPLGASASLSDMGANMDTPHSKLVVGQATWHPIANFEGGALITSQFGGKGGPEASFGDIVKDLFLLPSAPGVADKLISGYARVRVPKWRTQLFVNVLTTDAQVGARGVRETLTTEGAWSGGARVTGVGPDARADLWVEGHSVGVRPYTHHQFTSGYALDRRLIGDPLGPLGAGMSGGFQWRGPTRTVGVVGTWERYANADRYDRASDAFAWVRIEDNPDETRARVVFDWTTDAVRGRYVPRVRLGYERVTRFAFTTGARSNVMAQLRLDRR